MSTRIASGHVTAGIGVGVAWPDSLHRAQSLPRCRCHRMLPLWHRTHLSISLLSLNGGTCEGRHQQRAGSGLRCCRTDAPWLATAMLPQHASMLHPPQGSLSCALMGPHTAGTRRSCLPPPAALGSAMRSDERCWVPWMSVCHAPSIKRTSLLEDTESGTTHSTMPPLNRSELLHLGRLPWACIEQVRRFTDCPSGMQSACC
jgi:hypothetical protein